MSDPSFECAPSIEAVLALFDGWGADHYDEALSQLDHALQTAALATAAGATDALIAASLLHDVGHLLDLRDRQNGHTAAAGLPIAHETSGPQYLTPLFPESVTLPITLHVTAKRYLCGTDPTYVVGLSAGATASLVRQGGPMSADEARGFEHEPGFADAVALRRWDDLGKVHDLELAPLASYWGVLEHAELR